MLGKVRKTLVAITLFVLTGPPVFAGSGIGRPLPSSRAMPTRATFKPAGGPLRIMPLGDSLTAGLERPDGVPNGAYRTKLYWLLKNAKYQFVYVGSQEYGPKGPENSNDENVLPDTHNEGHGGWRIRDLDAKIEGWIQTYKPDIVLLTGGGNDEKFHDDLINAPQRYLDLVRKIRRLAPNALVLAQTRPVRNDGLQPLNDAFNSKVVSLISAENQADPLVRLVLNDKTIDVKELKKDRVHPNEEGNKKLAEVWFKAIVEALKETSARPLKPDPPSS